MTDCGSFCQQVSESGVVNSDRSMEKSLHLCGARPAGARLPLPEPECSRAAAGRCPSELPLSCRVPPLLNTLLKKKHAQRKLEVRNLRALGLILTSLLRSDKLSDGVFLCGSCVENRTGLFEPLKKDSKETRACPMSGNDVSTLMPSAGSPGQMQPLPALEHDGQETGLPADRSFATEASAIISTAANLLFQNPTCYSAQDAITTERCNNTAQPHVNNFCQSSPSHDLLPNVKAEKDVKTGIFQDKSEEASIDLVFDLLTQLQYHTHQEDGIEICDEFLQGICVYGNDCLKHHTVLPYHWQLRNIVTQTWQALSDDAQEHLERLYCNPENDQVKLQYQGRVFSLDFNLMTVYDAEFNQVRRLSTVSLASSNSQFHTVWKYYCREHFGWREYSEAVVQCIEEASSRGMSEICFVMQQNRYILNLMEGFQQNAVFGTRQRITRRPLFRSRVLLLPCLQTLAGTLGGLAKLPDGSVARQASLPAISSHAKLYPETWISMELSEDFIQVPVSIEDKSYRTVYNLFHKTIPETKFRILNILRVQNPYLWEKYKRKKEYMSRKMSEMDKILNERHLFHGTSQDVVDAICKHNFDPRVCGKHATMFGQGSYFARKASYSHNFSKKSQEGVHYMFLAKVLIGKYTLGKPSMRRPPPQSPTDPSSDLYDSCVDNLLEPQIFVIFNDDQSFPYFIIQYEDVGNTVTV
ncbi:protein mono-ADP-ribosyltransferase TIPARP isoform X1 [Hemiscyllium ocellatum]|uniref:protein mono-ADP-ribosyltransferase TIPARP isoform X1 n=2 Tax=Hemiscyllium ocellatum TaxID=170820 RepID=UPI00296757E7|nr:protein mono-ADP-ribosyltransferase TIPARP isoform X1 [Hemiscyllium ocellatum]